ncbi:MAG: hypothetical protein ABIK37_04635 [candidate division WOR-3 bacterium]
MLRTAVVASALLCMAASAQTPVWTHTWNGPGTAGEAAYAGCRDSSGNVYVCGSNEYEMLVAAVRPDGSELWTWRYVPPAGSEAEARDITYGSDGNLYVCGYVSGEDDDCAFCIVSLTSSGTERWRYEWSDPSVYYLDARGVIMGGDGNVYACGMVENDDTYQDVFVVSVTSGGSVRWTFAYDGGVGGLDEARDIIWGPDGNVHVCGTATPTDTSYADFAVLSLTPAGGLRWLHVYSPAAGVYHAAFRLVSDGQALFAAGVSCTENYEPRICVVSVATTGARRWVYERGTGSDYNRACDIIAGANGRVFVSGTIGDGSGYSDAVVIGLDSLGHEQWDWTWSNSANSEEVACGLALTSDGNIAVAGETYSMPGRGDILAASLTQSGAERWVRTIDGPASSYDGAEAVLAGPSGSAFCVGGITDTLTSSDMAVLRLSSSGSTDWTYTWDSGRRNGDDAANCVALAPDGTAYVTGSGYWGSDYNELAVLAITPSGQESWSYRYSLPGGMNAEGSAIAVGPDANVYVCGSGTDSAYWNRFLCVSLSPSGTERWTADVGPGRGLAIRTGPDNSVYACGELYDETHTSDFAVVAFTAAGSPRWTYSYDGGMDLLDGGTAVCTGPDSNVYACGYATAAGWWQTFTVLSLTSGGSLRWVWTDSAPENTWGSGYAIAPGADGNIYACGCYADASDYWLIVTSFTPAGVLRWRYQAPMPGTGQSLACGRDSTIYVAGSLYSDSTGRDMGVIALRPNGETLWVRTVPSPGYYEGAFSVAQGSDSLVYVAGTTNDDYENEYFTLACLDRSGRLLWNWQTRGDFPWGENSANCVVTRQDGSALVTGFVTGSGSGFDIFTALFSPGTGVAAPPAQSGPERFRVPSHFRGTLVCRLPKLAGPAQVRLVDVTGRVVTEGRVAAGAGEFFFAPAVTARLAAGAYFVQLVTPESTRTLRTVKID